MSGETSERRVVVVAFVQADGLGELAEAARARAVDAVMTRFRAVVERHGGTVDKFVGDTMMALFGAPVAHEDDPVRAVRTAIDLAGEAEAFAAESKRPLQIRAGLNRGEVLFGGIAGERATAMGDVVNTAQRLMAAAEPGQVLVSGALERLTRDAFAYDRLEPMAVKGRSEAVAAFALSGEKSGRTEFRILPELGTPLVGREADLARLVAACTADAGAFLFIEGDAGVGKSRLLAELRKALREKRPGLRVNVGRALEGVRLPLFALGEIVRADTGISGFQKGDAGRLVAALLDRLEAVEPSLPERENRAHLMAISLGYVIEGSRVAGIEPARMKAETHWAWEQWLRAKAAAGPLLVCIEDLHWADEATLDLLGVLAARLASAPVAIVATARPGARTPQGFERIALGDLSAEAALRLASIALGGPLAPRLAEFLHEKTGGNPYYVEELTRFLQDHALAAGSPVDLAGSADRIPEGLQGLLVSRLDALPVADKDALKGASIVGRAFWEKFLGSLLAREVDVSLAEARHRQMVFAQPDSILPGDRQYVFKHALLRDAAYSLVTKKERARLHAAAADLLELRAPDVGRRAKALAARHRESAGDLVSSSRLWTEAATEALEGPAWDEALASALEAERLGGGALASLVASRALFGLARYADAVQRAIDAALATRDPALLARIALAHADGLTGLGDWTGAAEAALRATADGADPFQQAAAFARRGASLTKLGRMDEAKTALARARELARFLPESREAALVRARLASAAGELAMALGRNDEAEASFQAMRVDSEKAGDRVGIATALAHASNVQRRRGNYPAALSFCEASLAIRREIGDRGGIAICLFGLGNIHLGCGANAEALVEYDRALALFRGMGGRSAEARCLSNMGNVHYRKGDLNAAMEAFRAALVINLELGERVGIATSHANIGSVQIRRGRYAEALGAVQSALAIHRELGDQSGIATGLFNLGDVCVGQGDHGKAIDFYAESLVISRALGQRPEVSACLVNLGNAHLYGGDHAAALAVYGEALALKREMGERFGVATALVNMANVRRNLGEWDAMIPLYEESIAIRRDIGDRFGLANSLRSLGMALCARDSFKEALVALEESLSLARALALPNLIRTALAETVFLACRRRGAPGPELEAAHRACTELERGGEDPGGSASLAIATFRAVLGDVEGVRAILRTRPLVPAEQVWDRVGTAEWHALVLRASGDMAGARRLLEESIALGRAKGLAGMTPPLEALLREIDGA